jgi:hypothetical protein
MRLKLPDNFGGISLNGKAVKLKADADGCVDAEHEVANALLSHGATPALAPTPTNPDANPDANPDSHADAFADVTSRDRPHEHRQGQGMARRQRREG